MDRIWDNPDDEVWNDLSPRRVRGDRQHMRGNEEDIQRLDAALAEVLPDFPDIRLIYLFGSRVEGEDLGPLSDYDLAILHGKAEGHDKVSAALSHSLRRKLECRVDVVSLNDATVDLAFGVISHGKLLYERDAATRVEYEARVMGFYFDYLPVLKENRRGILAGGDHATRVQRYRKAFGRTLRTLGEIGTSQG